MNHCQILLNTYADLDERSESPAETNNKVKHDLAQSIGIPDNNDVYNGLKTIKKLQYSVVQWKHQVGFGFSMEMDPEEPAMDRRSHREVQY